MQKLLLLLLLSVYACCLPAQTLLRGKVTAADTKKPVPLANVFLSNTSIGTITSEGGDFTIERFPAGRFDLVISCIGYETQVVTVQSAQLPPLSSDIPPTKNQ